MADSSANVMRRGFLSFATLGGFTQDRRKGLAIWVLRDASRSWQTGRYTSGLELVTSLINMMRMLARGNWSRAA